MQSMQCNVARQQASHVVPRKASALKPAGVRVVPTVGSRPLTIASVFSTSVTAVAPDPTDSEDEIALMERALDLARSRRSAAQVAQLTAAAPSAPAETEANTKAFTIKTFNAISQVGLRRFPAGRYIVSGNSSQLPTSPMAIMLRSHKLQVEEVPATVRCIVRCGAGTNNIPVAKMTELGIPVFNTPGANANAVKELVVCGLLLASRGILEGNAHVNNVINKEENMNYDRVAKRIEKDKAMFVGNEIEGKTLGVIGLGAIGGQVVRSALALGMNVVGYDPALSMDAALKLPGDRMQKANNLDELLRVCDYITIHVPYIKGATHHLLNATNLKLCKPNVHLLNFARGEIIDGEAVKDLWQSGRLSGKYISDFADPFLSGHPRYLVLPHLGASTEEAEDNSAAMAADTIKDFLETGTIRNSVNFPDTVLEAKPGHICARLCIVNKNEPGVLAKILEFVGTHNVNIEQEINKSRGEIAYTVLDFTTLEDPTQLQAELAAACPGIISSRFIGHVFHDEIGQPGSYFYVRWAAAAAAALN